MKKNAYVLIILAIFMFVSGGCVAQQQVQPAPENVGKKAPFPTFKVGDEWTYHYGVGEEITTKVLEVKSDQVVTESSNRSDCKEVRDLNFTLKELLCSGVVPVFNAERHLDFPLFVGKKWEYSNLRQSPTGNIYSCTIYAVVKSNEKIKLSCGEFQAFKIEMQIIGGPGWPLQLTYWYSPEVRAIVKLVSENYMKPPDRELVQYKIKN